MFFNNLHYTYVVGFTLIIIWSKFTRKFLNTHVNNKYTATYNHDHIIIYSRDEQYYHLYMKMYVDKLIKLIKLLLQILFPYLKCHSD